MTLWTIRTHGNVRPISLELVFHALRFLRSKTPPIGAKAQILDSDHTQSKGVKAFA